MARLILSTDFDGTILNHDTDGPMAPGFFDWMEEQKQKRHITWIINTGRTWDSLVEAMEQRKARFWPDWVVLIEREIHRVENGNPISLEPWNQQCDEVHADLFRRADQAFQETKSRLEEFEHLKIVRDSGSPMGLIARDNAQADEVVTLLQPMLNSFPDMQAVRNDIYLRFAHVDFDKGSCLEMIQREEGLSPEDCFVAGDNVNDLPMLKRRVAQFIACPSNSLQEVKSQVRAEGGHVGSRPADEGVLEALEMFFA